MRSHPLAGANVALQRRRSRRAGFTLVDVLVSTTLLVSATLGMTSVAASTSRLRQANRERTIAVLALDREAAALEAAPFDDLLAVHAGRGFELLAEESGRVQLRALRDDADGLPGRVDVAVPDVAGGGSQLLDVTIAIDWVGSFGPQRVARTLRISRLGAGG